MGNELTPLSEAEARHLLRRTGFGAPQKSVDKITGRARGEVVDDLLGYKPSKFRPRNPSIEIAHNKWFKYIVRTKLELQEKLVLFWHDHFSTSNDVVADATQMADQNRLLRVHAKGNFKTLVNAINRDPAMMDFLDTARNRKEKPNENYSRELKELFCLGVFDLDGNPNYAQEDIVQTARAFTGWRVDNDKDVAFFTDGRHDKGDAVEGWSPPRGPKVIFKNNLAFGAAGFDYEAASIALNNATPIEDGPYIYEIDAVIDGIFQHQDSAGRNTVAHWIAYRLITFFADPDPAISYVEDMVSASGFDTSFEIADLLRAIFVDERFFVPITDASKRSVKWPVDFVVSTLRLLNMKLKSRFQYVDGGSFDEIFDQLSNMGQVLFQPPSVFGWDWERAWLNSATLLARFGFARDVIAARGKGKTAFRPDRLFPFVDSVVDAGVVVDAVTALLGVQESFGPVSAERTALIAYLTDGAGGDVDFSDFGTRDMKLNGLVGLVLQSPAYMLH